MLVRGVRDEPHLAGRAVGHAVAPIATQVEVGGTGALVAASGGQQAEVAAAAVVDLAGVVGHYQRKRGERGAGGPSLRPQLPRLLAARGVRAVLAGNACSALSKAAQPICPGQRRGRSKPCPFRRELKPEIGAASPEVSGSGWASLSSGLSACGAWPWGSPPRLALLDSLGASLLQDPGLDPAGLQPLRARPQPVDRPPDRRVSTGTAQSAGEGSGQQPLLRRGAPPHTRAACARLASGRLSGCSAYRRAGAGRGGRAGPWAGAAC